MIVVRAFGGALAAGILTGMAYGGAFFVIAGIRDLEPVAGLMGMFIGVPYGMIFGAGYGAGLGVVAAVLFGLGGLKWRRDDPGLVSGQAQLVGAAVPIVGFFVASLTGLLGELDLYAWFFLLPFLIAIPVSAWLGPWIAGVRRYWDLPRLWRRRRKGTAVAQLGGSGASAGGAR